MVPPGPTLFDVFVTATGADAAREGAFVRLIELYPIDSSKERAFLDGDRVLLRPSVSDEEARSLLESIG